MLTIAIGVTLVALMVTGLLLLIASLLVGRRRNTPPLTGIPQGVVQDRSLPPARSRSPAAAAGTEAPRPSMLPTGIANKQDQPSAEISARNHAAGNDAPGNHASEHDAAEPETAQPETAQPETAEHDTAEHDTAEPDDVEHDDVEKNGRGSWSEEGETDRPADQPSGQRSAGPDGWPMAATRGEIGAAEGAVPAGQPWTVLGSHVAVAEFPATETLVEARPEATSSGTGMSPEIEEELTTLRLSQESSQVAMAELVAAGNHARAVAERHEASVLELRRLLGQHEATIASREREREDLCHQLKDWQRHHADAVAERQAAEHQVAELRARIVAMEEAHAAREVGLEARRSQELAAGEQSRAAQQHMQAEFERQQRELAALRARHDSDREQHDQLSQMLTSRESELSSLREQHRHVVAAQQQLREQRQQLQGAVRELQEVVRGLQDRVEACETAAPWQEERQARDHQIAHLQQQCRELQQQRDHAQAETARLQDRLAAVTVSASPGGWPSWPPDGEGSRLPNRQADWGRGQATKRVPQPNGRPGAAKTPHGDQYPRGRTESIGDASPDPATAAAKRPGERDDLKQIKGIGPAIEQKLNSIGICTYRQIADWGADDLDRLDRALSLGTRARRNAWVDQARELLSR